MEGAHPPKLSEDDGAAKILLRGLDDWVSLAEVRFLVSLAEPGDIPYLERDPVALRDASLRAITLLVEHDLARLGDVKAQFEPWPVSTKEALRRVRTEWWDPEKDLRPGNICWLANTPAGDEIARRIEAERGT